MYTPSKAGRENYRIGWFEYSEEPFSITNYLTGQKLVFSAGRRKNAGNVVMLDLLYSDTEISRLIVLEFARPSEKNRFSLFLDYNKIFTEPPAYGYWRRLDDFLTDALQSWPELFEFIAQPYELKFANRLLIMGGWHHAHWQPEFKRDYRGENLFRRQAARAVEERNTPVQAGALTAAAATAMLSGESSDYTICMPCVCPLDMPIPKQWHYVDSSIIRLPTSIPFKMSPHELPKDTARLDHEIISPLNIPYLAQNTPVQGFQGLTPFLESADQLMRLRC
jgi:hypothetical protein